MQGVYKIENLKNGKKYIGSSNNIERRFKEHKKKLLAGKHHSAKLQHAWRKAKNKDIFFFDVVEEVLDSEVLHEREQYYIDLYDAYHKGYNCAAKVDDPRFTKGNLNKRAREQEVSNLQKEFVSLYNSEKIEFKRRNPRKFINGEYKSQTYKPILVCMKWFLDTYPEKEYKCQIEIKTYDDKSGICLWIRYGYVYFAKYYYSKGKILLDKESTDGEIPYSKKRGRYDVIHHQLRGVMS